MSDVKTAPNPGNLPLEGVLVLEFCQYLSGPSAGLRLADLGARVIKIENPSTGDACRILPIKNQWIDDDSLLFHTINRNKESFTANLKDEKDLAFIHQLISKADVMVNNFRPGVMERLNLGYGKAQMLNPGIVYAEISGYGSTGPWAKKPGQDLLVQAISGLMHTSGNAGDPPTPFGLAIGDIFCGAQMVQGILAALFRKKRTGKGVKLELSLMESLIDFQFELLTTYFVDYEQPKRSENNHAHALLGAPYGIYQTKDGHLALAMIPIADLNKALENPDLSAFSQSDVFAKRDEIKATIAAILIHENSGYWMEKFNSCGLWATEVKNWNSLKASAGFQVLNTVQEIKISDSKTIKTTRCPIRLDGKRIFSPKAAPLLGADREKIIADFNLKEPDHETT
ncbi:CaiB/BaiF CoA transferase family protein [Belliella marina]|uniref:CaiB/BaiF CoA transferase family protein n=1 Tax=Belliella marina TaxID=1644146 RepID=A0ABW4VQK6_9BACT